MKKKEEHQDFNQMNENEEKEEEEELGFEHFVLAQSLTSVVNDPKVIPATKDWYSSEMVVLPIEGIPHIQLSDFNSYLDSIAKIYEDSSFPFSSSASSHGESSSMEKEKKKKSMISMMNQESNATSSPSLSFNSTLSIIPEMYFKERFVLEDEATFNSASDSDGNSPSSIQERLGQYLDIAETELVNQISYRSDSFFAALSTLQNLHKEVQLTCTKIDGLRIELKDLNERVSHELRIPNLERRRANEEKVNRKLKLIRDVSKARPTIQLLLANSDFASALQLISSTQQILKNELLGVTCLKHMNLELNEMMKLIEKMIEAEFIRIVGEFLETSNLHTFDLNEKISSYETSLPTEDEIDSFNERIIPLFMGLLRLGKFSSAFQTHRDEISFVIEEMMQKLLASIEEDKTLNSSITLGEKLNSLSPSQFLKLGSFLFSLFGGKLKRVSLIHTTFAQVLSAIALIGTSRIDDPLSICTSKVETIVAMTFPQYFSGNTFDSDLCTQYAMDCSDATGSVCELVHSKVAQVLKLRIESNTRLALEDFVSFFNSADQFISQTEKLGKRQNQLLKTTLHSQAKGFLELFHQKKISSLTLTLENENWTQVDVPYEFQEIADQLSGHKNSPSITSEGNLSRLTVGGQKIPVVNSSLILLKMLSDYVMLFGVLPSLSSDILPKMNEILGVFNSRTCQLILGAGAMHIQKLKSITAKHLALASQSLTIVLILAPEIKKTLSVTLSEKRYVLLLNDISRVLQDYSDHQKEIFLKFVTILKDRTVVHLRSLKAIDWNSAPLPSIPSTPLSNLLKETVTLQKVISQIIQEDQAKGVMANAIIMFQDKFREVISTISIQNNAGKALLFQDITTFSQGLSQYASVSEFDAFVNDLFQNHFHFQPTKR